MLASCSADKHFSQARRHQQHVYLLRVTCWAPEWTAQLQASLSVTRLLNLFLQWHRPAGCKEHYENNRWGIGFVGLIGENEMRPNILLSHKALFHLRHIRLVQVKYTNKTLKLSTFQTIFLPLFKCVLQVLDKNGQLNRVVQDDILNIVLLVGWVNKLTSLKEAL